MARGSQTQPFFAVGHQVRLISGFGEAALDVLADGTVVFDDEELHPATGRYTLKVVPTPICDSTSMRPE